MKSIRSYSDDHHDQRKVIGLLKSQQSKKEKIVMNEVRDAQRKRMSPSIPDLATTIYNIEESKKQKKHEKISGTTRKVNSQPPKLALSTDEMNKIIESGSLMRFASKSIEQQKIEIKEALEKLQILPRQSDSNMSTNIKDQNLIFSKAKNFDNLPQKAQLNQKLHRLKELGGKDKHKLMAAHAYNQNLEEIPYQRDKNIKRIEQFKHVTDRSAAKDEEDLDISKPRGRAGLKKHQKRLLQKMNKSLPDS